MKKKRTKIAKGQSQVNSQPQIRSSSKKIKQSPIKIETTNISPVKQALQNISEDVNTMASNQFESPRTDSRKKSFEFVSTTKSIDVPVPPRQICIPLLPATFIDWIHYESKCREIEEFLKEGVRKQQIIAWIQDNNRLNHGIQTNCSLLNQIQSEQFWIVIIHEMLSDVVRFSNSISHDKIRFISFQQFGNKKLQIGRGFCYIILIQWFFGLIPAQFHMFSSNSFCTFAPYMYRQQSKNQKNQLSEFDKIRLIKLKAIISYFSFMSIEQNHQTVQKQMVTFQITVLKTKKVFFNYPKLNKQNSKSIKQTQQDFGQISDQVFTEIQLKCYKQNSKDKINQGETHQVLFSFFEIDNLLNYEKFDRDKKKFKLQIFLLQHPQAFIVNLFFPGFQSQNSQLSIRGLRRWTICRYTEKNILYDYSRLNQAIFKKDFKTFSRLVLSKQQDSQQLTLKDYGFKVLKMKIEKYMNLVKASLKGNKQKQIIVPFDTFQYKDTYIDFMLLWAAISLAPKSKCSFVFEILQLDRHEKYGLIKLWQYFQGKQLGDMLNVIRNYQIFMNQKKQLFPSPKDLSFITYVKRHVF